MIFIPQEKREFRHGRIMFISGRSFYQRRRNLLKGGYIKHFYRKIKKK